MNRIDCVLMNHCQVWQLDRSTFDNPQLRHILIWELAQSSLYQINVLFEIAVFMMISIMSGH